ncbi:MAG: hypothetical protein EU536_01780 [Promethearchaeota archaeon]|nr:MAG: hypothetical protein EU536_01780 [Candidatus Lokiarchaeota archaeon]
MSEKDDLDAKIRGLKEEKQRVFRKLKYPEIFGTIQEEKIRCGKVNCKCSRGELHGPYYYLYIVHERELEKKYLCSVKKVSANYLEAKKGIQNAKHNKTIRYELAQINKQILDLERQKLELEDYLMS